MPSFTTRNSTITRLGMLNQFAPVAPFDDYNGGNIHTDTTLNNHRNSQGGTVQYANQNPGSEYPSYTCFSAGINGHGEGGEPRIPRSTDGDLYVPIPLRVVPLSSDSEPDDITTPGTSGAYWAAEDDDDADRERKRSTYRLREVRTLEAGTFALYWLKTIDWATSSTTEVRFAQIQSGSVIDSLSSPLDDISMTPDPTVGATDTQIIAYLAGQIYITNDEIDEAVRFMTPSELGTYVGDNVNQDNYTNGNAISSLINELGICTGLERPGTILTDADGTDSGLTFTESSYTQLAYHRCMPGFNLGSNDSFYQEELYIENGNLALL